MEMERILFLFPIGGNGSSFETKYINKTDFLFLFLILFDFCDLFGTCLCIYKKRESSIYLALSSNYV